MKTKWLDRRISAPGPYLALCLSEAEFYAALRHAKARYQSNWISTPQANATAHFLPNSDGELCCIVCLGPHENRSAIEIAGLLVHESVHIFQEYCAHIGEDHPASEQQAYGIQSIAQELLSEFGRRLK